MTNKLNLRKIVSSAFPILLIIFTVLFILFKPKEVRATITEVSTSGSTTLDQASYTLVNSMQTTPGAGDYLAVFTMEVLSDAIAWNNSLFVAIYVNDIQQAHSIRRLDSDSSIDAGVTTTTTHAYITASAGQVVDVRYLNDGSPAFTGREIGRAHV